MSEFSKNLYRYWRCCQQISASEALELARAGTLPITGNADVDWLIVLHDEADA